MHCPSVAHMTAATRILRYLAGSISLGLQLSACSQLSLTAYSDSDWAGCPTTRKSTSRFCVFLGPNLVSWSLKKQPTVARSSTEAEYRALASTVAESLGSYPSYCFRFSSVRRNVSNILLLQHHHHQHQPSSPGDTSSTGISTLLDIPVSPPTLLNVRHHVSLELSYTNYLSWKKMMSTFLDCQDILGIVDGTFPQPASI
ncbi:hypothetical protein LIER_37587 [Lithospermum erythrorhizon]|uniref:Retrotransposon Copia-like N-terminal domain-containing protein n=1 Tax=Lithospermum erythrorhizon TaxID=34254 RepID=A0AAV3PQ82_LITER